MTTIAYSHKDKVIATDSRVTSGNLIVTNTATKFLKIGGEYFFGAGSADDWKLLIEIYLGGEPTKNTYDCTVMFTEGGSVHLMTYTGGSFNRWELQEDTVIGSGTEFALAAMDFGKSAPNAVRYAITRDNCSGGKVRTIKVPQ